MPVEARSQNPFVPKFLWMDFDRFRGSELDDTSGYAREKGFKLRNLRTAIPAYAGNSLFNPIPGSDSRIWDQVDLARILVLHHCLDVLEFENAFYSDVDIPNVQLDAEHLRCIFNRYGMVFNSRAYAPGDSILENQFIGFNRALKRFIEDSLLPEMYSAIETRVNVDNLYGLYGLYRALEKRFPDKPDDLLFLTIRKFEKSFVLGHGFGRPSVPGAAYFC